MIDFDTFWGIETILAGFNLTELWHLYVVHALIVGIIFCLNVVLIRPVLGAIDKRLLSISRWISDVLLGFTFIWVFIHGALILLLGEQLLMARYLYVYLIVALMTAISQTHIQLAVPDFIDNSDMERGSISVTGD